MSEITFEVVEDENDGGYSASALAPGYGIHTGAILSRSFAEMSEMRSSVSSETRGSPRPSGFGSTRTNLPVHENEP